MDTITRWGRRYCYSSPNKLKHCPLQPWATSQLWCLSLLPLRTARLESLRSHCRGPSFFRYALGFTLMKSQKLAFSLSRTDSAQSSLQLSARFLGWGAYFSKEIQAYRSALQVLHSSYLKKCRSKLRRVAPHF